MSSGRAGASPVSCDDCLGEGCEFLAHHVGIKRLIAAGAEDVREMIGVQFAQHDVAVGHGQRPAAAVTGGAGIGTGTFGTDLKAAVA